MFAVVVVAVVRCTIRLHCARVGEEVGAAELWWLVVLWRCWLCRELMRLFVCERETGREGAACVCVCFLCVSNFLSKNGCQVCHQNDSLAEFYVARESLLLRFGGFPEFGYKYNNYFCTKLI